MKSRKLTIQVGFLLAILGLGPVAFAQLSGDSPESDPSTQPHLGLDGNIIQQKRFARTQFFRGIFLGEYFKQTADKIFHARYRKMLSRHPEWFDLLIQHESRYQPSAPNGPALINASFEFAGISKLDYGYCWGFVTMIRNFSVLAFFDPSASPIDQKGRELSATADRDAWIEYYEQKIEDVVVYGKATVIPGFAGFRELSLVPELELYLKLKTMHLWRWFAIRGSGFAALLRSRHDLTREQALSLLDDLEARHRRHEMPKLIITTKARNKKPFSFAKDLHVILSYGVERTPDGGGRIRLWDPNFYAESIAKSPKEIVITGDGKITYAPWIETGTEDAAISDQLGRVELAPENNAETVDQLYELKRFCTNENTARYCQP
jgi:hypothetical protein